MIRIFKGDFRSVHKRTTRADLVLIDPPYNQGKPYVGVSDQLTPSEYRELITDSCWAAHDLVGSSGRVAIILSNKLLALWLPKVVLQFGAEDVRVIAVHKRAKGVRVGGMYNQWVPIITVGRPAARCDDFWSDIRLPGEGFYFREDRHGHPAITSLALTKRLVEHFTKPGELVVDFFAGVGTTGVACAELGRDFVGVEASSKYVAIARERFRELR